MAKKLSQPVKRTKEHLNKRMNLSISLIMSFFLLTNATEQFTGKRQLLIFGQPQSQLVLQQLELLKIDADGVEEEISLLPLWQKKIQSVKSIRWMHPGR